MNTPGSVCVQGDQFLCVLPRSDTQWGFFCYVCKLTLANDTDMGGALSFLENRFRIQNIDQVEKSPEKKEKVIQKRMSTKL